MINYDSDSLERESEERRDGDLIRQQAQNGVKNCLSLKQSFENPRKGPHKGFSLSLCLVHLVLPCLVELSFLDTLLAFLIHLLF